MALKFIESFRHRLFPDIRTGVFTVIFVFIPIAWSLIAAYWTFFGKLISWNYSEIDAFKTYLWALIVYSGCSLAMMLTIIKVMSNDTMFKLLSLEIEILRKASQTVSEYHESQEKITMNMENILGGKLRYYLKSRLSNESNFFFTIKRIQKGSRTIDVFYRDADQSRDRSAFNTSCEDIKDHHMLDCFNSDLDKPEDLNCLVYHNIPILPDNFRIFKDRAKQHNYSTTLCFPLEGAPSLPESGTLNIEERNLRGFFSIDSPSANVLRDLFRIDIRDKRATNAGEHHVFKREKELFFGLSDFINTIFVLENRFSERGGTE
jgi:hypothetical protein